MLAASVEDEVRRARSDPGTTARGDEVSRARSDSASGVSSASPMRRRLRAEAAEGSDVDWRDVTNL